ncbi:MAG: phosphoribosylanthranilate isomerase [Polyangiaceae bacterium]|nr:phosphoribosylanthranilate isomerase [Polyangiaceae bacterium]
MYIKICGVTCLEDAELVRGSGASALGVNLVPGSVRRVDLDRARAIVASVAGRLETVAVVGSLTAMELRTLRTEVPVDWVQLHGEIAPEVVMSALPSAFVALRIAEATDVELAWGVPGDRLLVDAKVPGALGGTGRTFDWSLVVELARKRRLILAGGLHPGNVGAAIEAVSPWGVDVASGVERAFDPRRKDPDRVAAFVAAARGRPS